MSRRYFQVLEKQVYILTVFFRLLLISFLHLFFFLYFTTIYPFFQAFLGMLLIASFVVLCTPCAPKGLFLSFLWRMGGGSQLRCPGFWNFLGAIILNIYVLRHARYLYYSSYVTAGLLRLLTNAVEYWPLFLIPFFQVIYYTILDWHRDSVVHWWIYEIVGKLFWLLYFFIFYTVYYEEFVILCNVST